MRGLRTNSIAVLLTAVILAAAVPAGAESVSGGASAAAADRLATVTTGVPEAAIAEGGCGGANRLAGGQVIAGSGYSVATVAYRDDWRYIGGRPYRCDRFGHWYPVYSEGRAYGYVAPRGDYGRGYYDRGYRDFRGHDRDFRGRDRDRYRDDRGRRY